MFGQSVCRLLESRCSLVGILGLTGFLLVGGSVGCDGQPVPSSAPRSGGTYPGSPGPLPPLDTKPSAPPGTPSPGQPDLETEVLVMVNQARATMGLDQLKQDAKLQFMARNYSKAMASAGVLSHDLGGGFQVRIGSSGVQWLQAGENIAEGYPTAQGVFNGWMNSPGHRANILRPVYMLTGVGLFRDNRGTVWWSQEFVQKAPSYLGQPVADRPKDFLHLPGGIRASDSERKQPDAKEEDSPWEEPVTAPIEWVVQPRPGIRNPNPNPWPSPRQIKRIRERHGG